MIASEERIVVLGIGNVLWADEGFGVRTIESLNERFIVPDHVQLVEGGTQGLYLLDYVKSASHLIILDAIDFGLPPGTLKLVENEAVPAWGATKMSLHQTGFQEVLALAKLSGNYPTNILLIGVQPLDLSDFGGSLTEPVRARVPEAVAIAVRQLVDWGCRVTRRREPPSNDERLNAPGIALERYETQRPDDASACRIGDSRFLAIRVAREAR